ncbi:MAG: hypothetical protein IJT76_00950, partial [Clostridia bacterium]|nr:hypothetical protein [Clostridia bacterium]
MNHKKQSTGAARPRPFSLSKKSKSPKRRFCLSIVFGRFLCENGQKHRDPPPFFAKNAAKPGP